MERINTSVHIYYICVMNKNRKIVLFRCNWNHFQETFSFDINHIFYRGFKSLLSLLSWMKEDFASFEIILYAKILFCKYSDTNDKYTYHEQRMITLTK